MAKPKVYLVGAGPGDPELITLKGYKLISQADVILHDHLIPTELLQLAKPTAEIITVAKSAGAHALPQEKINELLIEKAKTAKVVVRLKGGDPYLFGRGAEETQACADAGIDFEVVPGITSALAAPAYAGIPPAHRDYTSNLAIVTGHRRQGKTELEIPKAGTVIFLMGVANLEKIIDSLLKDAWNSNTPIAAIENGTCYNQRVLTGTLDNFLLIATKADLKPPAVIVVGKVVELHEKLDWFSGKPRILVVGTHPEKYAHLGSIVHRPMIKLLPIEDYTQTDKTLQRLSDFDWLVFTSTNGVKFFFQRLFDISLDARALGNAKVAAIGSTTAEMLSSFAILADIQPTEETSVGMLKEFEKIGVQDKKVLLVRPEDTPPALSEGLTELGAKCEQVAVYENIEIEPQQIDFDAIDRILFTSASTVRAFVKYFHSVPDHIKALCLGPPTLEEAKKHGITHAELLNNPT